MPRRPKPPRELVIQRLSDGRVVREATFVDDFTGEVRGIVQDDSPVRELPDGQELRDAHNRAKRDAAQAFLQRVGVLAKAPDPVALATPEGHRVLAVAGGLVFTVPRKPFRRV